MTERVWRLTPQAEESLTEIARWTIDACGAAQAEVHEAAIIERCAAVAAEAAPSQDASALFEDGAGLRFTRCGSHSIVFVEIGAEVVILDFVYGRADLPRRLCALREAAPGGRRKG